MLITVNGHFFSLDRINQLVFQLEMRCVYCEVGTEVLKIMSFVWGVAP